MKNKIVLEELKCIEENIDLDKYIECREEVKLHMEHPEWLGDFSKEDLIDLLGSGSKIWMYYKDEEFVCSMMIIPSREKDLIKFGLELNYKDVIDYGPQFVNFKYIGNSLQYQMLQKLDEYCLGEGYCYAASTIHPDNEYSINNLKRDGFICKGQREFKRGLRNIYLKNLKEK